MDQSEVIIWRRAKRFSNADINEYRFRDFYLFAPFKVQDYEHRSISPNGYVTNEENESDNASNNEVSNSPATPFLQTPIKIEQVDPDEMPLLKKAPGRRGRRRKRPLGLPKPTLSPAKIRPNIEGDELKSRNAVEFNIGNIDEFLNIRSNDSSLSNVSWNRTDLFCFTGEKI
jgi:hypothetical protein